MSICDRCIQPGACCRGFRLSLRFEPGMTTEAVHAEMMSRSTEPERVADMVPVHENDPPPEDEGRVRWTFNCSRLRADGRCGNHKDRPQLCRDFQPLSDRLCVMHIPEDTQ